MPVKFVSLFYQDTTAVIYKKMKAHPSQPGRKMKKKEIKKLIKFLNKINDFTYTRDTYFNLKYEQCIYKKIHKIFYFN